MCGPNDGAGIKHLQRFYFNRFILKRTNPVSIRAGNLLQLNNMKLTNSRLTLWERVKVAVFLWSPHHLVSRLIYFLTRLETRRKDPVVRWYIRRFKVNMSETARTDPSDYLSFNEFFTRTLRQGARPVCDDPRTLASACDGTMLEHGNIEEGTLLQAKGQAYTLPRLFAETSSCTDSFSQAFSRGRYSTIYLAPGDYHRVHMPTDGQLVQMIHVPGRLFSVAPYALKRIPNLYTRNERVICIFETALGLIAVIMIGALNVGCIETVWHGLVTPLSHRASRIDYARQKPDPVYLKRGDEMGHFNLGSTVILLAANTALQWNPSCAIGTTVRMGEEIACLIKEKKAANVWEPYMTAN